MIKLVYIFWISLFIVSYTYVGYGILIYILKKIKEVFNQGRKELLDNYEPEVTLLIAAYNERDYLPAKVNNSLSLDYPQDKLKILFVTDGSDDGSDEYLRNSKGVSVLHESARRGKISAMNRGMDHVRTPIVVFTDCNTELGKGSIRKIVEMFADSRVGCISGEKRVASGSIDAASGSGEGIYCKYESKIKKWEASFTSTVGAAGELFAIRRELFEHVEADTLLDDFMISLRIAMKGYKIQYDPEAYAVETASLNVKEELKRKVRIAAGAVQSVFRLKKLLNPFRFGWLSFQYISHKFLRWMIAPVLLLVILISNLLLIELDRIYLTFLVLQFLFYGMAILGWLFQNKRIRLKGFFVPYYFTVMNLAMFMGYWRFLKGNQSVNWEKAKRS